ncbi:MAG: hypothetical protein V7459_17235 [Oceanicoccus sp.]
MLHRRDQREGAYYYFHYSLSSWAILYIDSIFLSTPPEQQNSRDTDHNFVDFPANAA